MRFIGRDKFNNMFRARTGIMVRSITLFSIVCCSVLSLQAQEQFIEIDGFSIWTKSSGLEERVEGEPVIVLESGLGTPMDHWDRVFDGFAELAPVVAYDRPGIGKSDEDDEMPTLKNVSDKLLELLDNLEVEPPYVLVGHSMGGAYVRGFAVYYPELLAGLVIIDPADFTENHVNRRDYYEVLEWNDDQIDKKLEELEGNHQRNIDRTQGAVKEERLVLAELREREFAIFTDNPLPNIPVHIITGGRFDMPERMRSTEYDEEALFRSKMKHRVARWTDVIQSVDRGMMLYSGDAGHFVHYDDPKLVISSVEIVLDDYRELKDGKR